MYVYDKDLYDGITLQEIFEMYEGSNFDKIQICFQVEARNYSDEDYYEEPIINIYSLRLETDEEHNIRIKRENKIKEEAKERAKKEKETAEEKKQKKILKLKKELKKLEGEK